MGIIRTIKRSAASFRQANSLRGAREYRRSRQGGRPGEGFNRDKGGGWAREYGLGGFELSLERAGYKFTQSGFFGSRTGRANFEWVARRLDHLLELPRLASREGQELKAELDEAQATVVVSDEADRKWQTTLGQIETVLKGVDKIIADTKAAAIQIEEIPPYAPYSEETDRAYRTFKAAQEIGGSMSLPLSEEKQIDLLLGRPILVAPDPEQRSLTTEELRESLLDAPEVELCPTHGFHVLGGDEDVRSDWVMAVGMFVTCGYKFSLNSDYYS